MYGVHTGLVVATGAGGLALILKIRINCKDYMYGTHTGLVVATGAGGLALARYCCLINLSHKHNIHVQF